MVDKKFCDVCNKEIDIKLDRLGYLNYGFGPSFNLFGNKGKKGQLCESCLKKIDSYIITLKGGKAL
jgi:hypothetical protein